MRTVRKTVVILAAVAGLLAIAAPAFAHEENVGLPEMAE